MDNRNVFNKTRHWKYSYCFHSCCVFLSSLMGAFPLNVAYYIMVCIFFWCATVQLFSSQAVLLGLGVPLEFMCRKLHPLSYVNDGRWGLWEANESWEPSLSEWNNPFMDWESPETMTVWISYPEKGVVWKARLASFHQCLTIWNTAWDFIESLPVTASCLAQVLDLGLARSQNCRKPKSILDTWSHLRYFHYTNRK